MSKNILAVIKHWYQGVTSTIVFLAGWIASILLLTIAGIQIWGVLTSFIPHANASTDEGSKISSAPKTNGKFEGTTKENAGLPNPENNIITGKSIDKTTGTLSVENKITGRTDSINRPDGSPPTADTISALGIVIAAVTLMLSLGTSSIASLQKRFQQILRKMDDLNRREMNRNMLIQYRLAAHSELLMFYRQSRGETGASNTVIYLMPWLELLSSEDEGVRKTAYNWLRKYLGQALQVDLPVTWRYCIEVEHYLLSAKLARRENSFCGVFDPPLRDNH